MYRLCVNVYGHRVTTQLQLINISNSGTYEQHYNVVCKVLIFVFLQIPLSV